MEHAINYIKKSVFGHELPKNKICFRV